MPEISIILSTLPIMNFFYILTVLFTGYFLYLIFFRDRRRQRSHKEIEIFLYILIFGMFSFIAYYFIFYLTTIIPCILFDVKYIGYYFQGIVTGSAILVLLHVFKSNFLSGANNCIKILCMLIPLIFGIICVFILPKIPSLNYCGDFIETQIFNITEIHKTNLTEENYCKLECYKNYKVNSFKVGDMIPINNDSIGFHCYCYINICNP